MDKEIEKEEVACGTCGWRGTYKQANFDQPTRTYNCPQCLSPYLVQVSDSLNDKS